MSAKRMDPYYRPHLYVSEPYKAGVRPYCSFQWMNLMICNPWWTRSVCVSLASPADFWGEGAPIYKTLFVLGCNWNKPGFLRMHHDDAGTGHPETGFYICSRCGAIHPSERRCLWIWQWIPKAIRELWLERKGYMHYHFAAPRAGDVQSCSRCSAILVDYRGTQTTADRRLFFRAGKSVRNHVMCNPR